MWIETKLRVRYAETDKMGIVHHANYYVWFELGRSDYCRAHGFSYLELEELENTRMLVAESQCRYKAPAFYEDELVVRTSIGKSGRRIMTFEYEIERPKDGTIIATGKTVHAVTDTENRVRSLPQKYLDLLNSRP